MTDGGGNEGNGRISNIMNSLWGNNGSDDTLFDTFKLVYYTHYLIHIYTVIVILCRQKSRG